MRPVRPFLFAFATVFAALQGSIAHAQGNPAARPVRIVVPFGAGSVGDIAGRMIADALSKRLGVAVIIDPRAGAAGQIGTQAVSRAEPDGTTMLLNSNSVTILQAISANTELVDMLRDLEPVTQAIRGALGVYVTPSLPIRSVADLIAYAKQRPGVLNFASSGVGGAVHMSTELFKLAAGVDMVHVPFNNTAAQMNAVASNEVQLLLFDTGLARPLSDAGRIRFIAVTTLQRLPNFPDVPTASESGLPGFETGFWYGFFAPPKTPKAVLERINADLVAVLQESSLKDRLQQQGYIPVGSSPEQFRKKISDEVDIWTKVARSAKVPKQ